jgi:hypothetical protein
MADWEDSQRSFRIGQAEQPMQLFIVKRADSGGNQSEGDRL